MNESACLFSEAGLTKIEPEARLVVLARTMQAQGPESETALKNGVTKWAGLGETCLGQALYRHHSVFQNASEASVWTHLELSYFRDVVPVGAIRDLVFARHAAEAHLLRAEILLTTRSAFVMPQGWQGSANHPARRVSLEFIDVAAAYLGEYRDIMRTYIGPAAAKLVAIGKIGTFRAMETAGVIYQDPSFNIDWNQVHLSEVDSATFEGFGQEFDAALREIAPDARFVDVFAGLGSMRTIPRWTFNDPVVEADFAIGRLGSKTLTRSPLLRNT
jgi:hypothetical protein